MKNDLIELTVIQGYNGPDTFMPQIEDAITETILLSSSSIASIEPLGDLYHQNALVTLKEQRGDSAVSYRVTEKVEEIKQLLNAAAKHTLKPLRRIEHKNGRGYFHSWVISKYQDNGEEYALALVEDIDGTVHYVDVAHGDIKFIDNAKVEQPKA